MGFLFQKDNHSKKHVRTLGINNAIESSKLPEQSTGDLYGPQNLQTVPVLALQMWLLLHIHLFLRSAKLNILIAEWGPFAHHPAANCWGVGQGQAEDTST